MKRIAFVFVFLPLLFPFGTVKAYAVTPDKIYSPYAVLMDADTGQVLYSKNMNDRAFPASTTKIMTGIIAVEQCFPGETLIVSENAVDIDVPGSSNIALVSGEELTLDSAMYALMMPSANDAANVIAEHVGQTQEKFAEMMNEKAKTIGAVNTHFANAHGLHDDKHYTTAYDIALITRYAAGNETFMRYFGRDLYTMPATNLQESERPFTNYQYMLVKSTNYYNEDVIGGKVGYTNEAKHTMSTVAKRDGRTLICVTMGSANRNEKFKDTKILLDFGFDEFTKVTIPADNFNGFAVPVNDSGSRVGEAFFKAVSDFTFLLHNDFDPSAVTFDYTAPVFIEKDGGAALSVSLLADSDNENIPSLLISKPLKADMYIQASPSPVDSGVSGASYENVKAFYYAVLAFSFMLFIVSMMLIRRYNIRRRRKARLERLQKKMQTYSPDLNIPPRDKRRYSA